MSVLQLAGVHAGYGPVEVLRGVDLTVPAGSIVALLGANGAGKTSTLRVAAGFLPTRRGRVSFAGEAVTASRPHARAAAGLCLIPEGRGVFTQLTVRENVAMFAGGREVDDAVAKATEAFPVLGKRLGQVAGTLSGGEQQMLAVSRALITSPLLVMADELSVGLAPVVIDAILDAVLGMRAAGTSLLVVEQYVDRLLAVADYVYVLHKGTPVFVGEPKQFEDADVFEHYLGGAA